MKCLFWNTHNNDQINSILSDLIVSNQIDFVSLAEYKADKQELLNILQSQGVLMREQVTVGCSRITILSSIENIEPATQANHYSLQIISKKYIVCSLHLLSNIYANNEGAREIVINTLLSDINTTEVNTGLDSTIILGDFNMDPFEKYCIAANYFNSMPYYDIACKQKRVIEETTFKMFYNPMWRFLSSKESPNGTHYYSGSRVDNIYWHVYDQVMIRPCLYKSFKDDSLRIITESSFCSLLDRHGHPDSERVSDHLPIVFELEEND